MQWGKDLSFVHSLRVKPGQCLNKGYYRMSHKFNNYTLEFWIFGISLIWKYLLPFSRSWIAEQNLPLNHPVSLWLEWIPCATVHRNDQRVDDHCRTSLKTLRKFHKHVIFAAGLWLLEHCFYRYPAKEEDQEDIIITDLSTADNLKQK